MTIAEPVETQSDVPHHPPRARTTGLMTGELDLYRAVIRRVGGARWFDWLGIHVMTPLDKWLYPRFHGRVISAGPPILPLLFLTSTGRRSGRPRSTPLLYLPDGDDMVIVGSNWAQAHHPAWSGNLLAEPHARVEIDGRERAVVARVPTATERERLWPRLLALFPPYQTLADRSRRQLRLFILTPVRQRRGPTMA